MTYATVPAKCLASDLWQARCVPRLVSIHIYPVKSLHGVAPDTAEVEPWGLAGDRRYMLVDPDGRFLSQRRHPVLTQAGAEPLPGGGVRLTAARHTGLPELVVPPPSGDALVDVTVWRSALPAAPCVDKAHAWFSELLGTDVRLVHLDDPTRRPVNPARGRETDRVSFADGYPLLLTTTGSLRRLNGWLAETGTDPLPMNRFRPSIVVDEEEPFAEDGWRRIRVGAVDFRVAKPCGRCVVTTTDQHTGARAAEPLRTLGRHRRFGDQLVFGQNLIPDGTGAVHVGDRVDVVA